MNILESVQQENIEQEILGSDQYKFNLDTPSQVLLLRILTIIKLLNFNIHEEFEQNHKIIQSYMQTTVQTRTKTYANTPQQLLRQDRHIHKWIRISRTSWRLVRVVISSSHTQQNTW